MEQPPLSESDAMTIVMVATDLFVSMNETDLPLAQRQGWVLFFDGLMQQAKPKLPQTPEMAHIFKMMGEVHTLARGIRQQLGLAVVM